MSDSLCYSCQRQMQHDLTWKQLIGLSPLSFPLFCSKCLNQFQRLTRSDSACQGCGRSMDDKTNKYTYCYDCFRWLQTYPEAILAHQAIFQYDEVFSEWLSRLKYHGDVRLAKIMVDTLSEIYLQYEDYAWIILPSSPESIHERGFHSTAILLMEAGIAFSEPFDYIGDGRKQAKKPRDERIQLGQSFQIKSDFVFNQSKYLIFDDVYTTGATLLQAKNLLRLALIAGESDALVESLTLAHHQMLD